ncbi:Hypothetical predicted protein [Podarcis lilfordi]|uniref:Uncharacterized protein n=1 Tax=Podarcis lilfordi TaxID=74358 RepID=A0AA35K4L7_9SAUR|nr:Hypothetical predicted protein [Podarcis lilfordi]
MGASYPIIPGMSTGSNPDGRQAVELKLQRSSSHTLESRNEHGSSVSWNEEGEGADPLSPRSHQIGGLQDRSRHKRRLGCFWFHWKKPHQ